MKSRDFGNAHHGCLKCSAEEIYRDGLCRRHHNIEKILTKVTATSKGERR